MVTTLNVGEVVEVIDEAVNWGGSTEPVPVTPIRTLAMLSSFFGRPLIRPATHRYTLPEEDHPTMVAEGE